MPFRRRCDTCHQALYHPYVMRHDERYAWCWDCAFKKGFLTELGYRGLRRQGEYDEPLLMDEQPVYEDFWYLVDGNPKRSPILAKVRDLKKLFNTDDIRRCDAVERGLPMS